MSDTPETDTPQTDQFWETSAGGSDGLWHARDFCREMERERDEARSLAKYWQEQYGHANPGHEWQELPWNAGRETRPRSRRNPARKTMNKKQNPEAADLPRFVRCECSMATRVLGDGCRYCNPELGAELKWNSEADDYNQWDDLGQDEKDHLIAEFISANASVEASPNTKQP